MKFVCLGSRETEAEILKNEYKAAKRHGEVRLSDTRLFYRYFIKIRYIDYEEIVNAYLREESGESGEFLLKEFYLMLRTKDGSLHKLRTERSENAKAVLAYLEKTQGHIAVGFDRLSQSE